MAAHEIVGLAAVLVSGAAAMDPNCGLRARNPEASFVGSGVGVAAGLVASILHCASLEEERKFISCDK